MKLRVKYHKSSDQFYIQENFLWIFWNGVGTKMATYDGGSITSIKYYPNAEEAEEELLNIIKTHIKDTKQDEIEKMRRAKKHQEYQKVTLEVDSTNLLKNRPELFL